MLTFYQSALQNLLQTPQQPTPLITAAQETVYINQARQHVAAEGECVRVYGSLTLVINQRSYSFLNIAFGTVMGVSGVNNVRTLWYGTPAFAGSSTWVQPREFEWFGVYGGLNSLVPATGPPTMWAQFGQGQQGTLFIDPLPDAAYVCPVDIVAAPIPLVNDTTTEAIPPLWQDAVPFYAAWLAFMNLVRLADADTMIKNYETLMQRARVAATPSVLPHQYAQGPDRAMANAAPQQARAAG